MSRIAACFAALQADGRRALIPFVTAADPAATVTVPLMHAMAARGADIIELGVPFSDPMADGPVIQRASERALAGGASLSGVLDIVASFRTDDATTPVVLMGYLNPIEAMGYETFAAAAAEAGVDGVLTVDLPPEEGDELIRPLRARDIDPIFLLAPNSSTERVARVSAQASGYVYYVSLKGVTGSAALDVDSVAARVSAIKAASDLPVGVGFGIRDAETAARVAAVSDAVVVGSVLVQTTEDSLDQPDMIPERVSAIIASMRAAMDAAA